MPLHRVAYCSRNTNGGDPASVDAMIAGILARSRRNNAANGITGGLLFSAACFAQVLEGPIDEVDDTFERVRRDRRHADVTVLRSEPIDGRDFRGWSMACAGSAATPTLRALLGRSSFEAGGAAADSLRRLLADVVDREPEWLGNLGHARAREPA